MKKDENKVNSSSYKKNKNLQEFEAVEKKAKKRTNRLKEIGKFKNRGDVNLMLTNK
jgi:hypothetical protein